MKNISVIGAGTMGNGIAHTFALAGYQVKLIDISQERLNSGLKTIEKNLDRQVSKEKISQEQMQQTLNRISLTTEIRTGVTDSDLVIEAATEKLELKLEIFKTIDQSAPKQCILATNTSSISITQIAGVTSRPEMVIGMHFMNPVPIMKLVEVIRGYNTSDKTTKLVMELSKDLGKIPTEVNDYPGFIANRILMPMINEAIESLFQGVAGVKEIDTVMKLGMAHPMGPLELADFIGLDVCLSILEVMYDGFKNPKYAPCPLLVNMVRSGNLGKKSGSGFYDYSQERKAVIVSQQFQ
ncbi:MAG: 3-hydroxyacyl-CoA dehydrogenase family protein [Flavobacteriaceae bacterium]